MKYDVFISHTGEDEKHASAALAALESAGFTCWISTRDIRPTTEWSESIVRAIKGSRALLVIFSSHANNSDHITVEVEQAFKNRLPIVLFRVEDVEPDDGLTYFVGLKHWLNAFPRPKDKHPQLVETVRRLLTDERLPPPPPPPPPRPRFPRWLVVAGVVLLAATAIIGARAWLRSDRPPVVVNTDATPTGSPAGTQTNTQTAPPALTATASPVNTATAPPASAATPGTSAGTDPAPDDLLLPLIREFAGADSDAVRADVIHRMGELAKNDINLHTRVVEQLTSFIRARARRQGKCSNRTPPHMPPDLQKALDVLATRRWWYKHDETERLDLRETDLSGAVFQKKGRFDGVRLRGACLDNAVLKEASFRCADLYGASVKDIDVTDTDLYGADVSHWTGTDKAYIDSLLAEAVNLNKPPCAHGR